MHAAAKTHTDDACHRTCVLTQGEHKEDAIETPPTVFFFFLIQCVCQMQRKSGDAG